MDGVVRTVLGGALVDTLHPSYQPWSYAELLRGFNESIYEGDIALHLARTPAPDQKRVLIVHGGPGTGKSVVAIRRSG
jgi:hypothetical protein